MSDKRRPKVPESLGAQGERLSDTLGGVCLTKRGQKCRKALGLKEKGCRTWFIVKMFLNTGSLVVQGKDVSNGSFAKKGDVVNV